MYLFLGLCAVVVVGYATLYSSLYKIDDTVFDNIPKDQYTFLHFLYFSVVTIATVGYGDITPSQNLIARLLVTSEIVSGFLIVFTFVTFVSLTFKSDKEKE